MKRFLVICKLRSTASLVALLLSGSLMAGQIDSVCKTDDQTLNGIKSDPDQTLWVFMQTVCQGQFVITKSPVRPQPSVISPAAAEVTTLNSEVSVIPLGKVDSPAQSTQSTVGIDAINSQAKSVTARIETESMTKHNSLEVGTQPRETNEPTVSLAKKERNPEQNSAEIVAEVQPDNTVSNPGNQEIQTNKTDDVRAIENRETKDKSYQSNRPWLYALLGPQVARPVIETLPPPIEYEPTRFSNYKPDHVSQSTASNHGAGYLQKPGVMSVVPHGFYVGTSLFWDQTGNEDTYSAFPSLFLGYADEKAVREFETYPGLGSRVELKVERLKDDEDRTEWNRYSALGEIYVPVGGGVFTGIGGKYEFDKDVPVSGLGTPSSKRWNAYLPLGIGFTNTMGHSGKIQLNTLIGSKVTADLSRETAGAASDWKIKWEAGDAYGLDFAYSWNAHSEAFVNYWWYDKSEPYTVTANGTALTDRSSKYWTLDLGYRFYW